MAESAASSSNNEHLAERRGLIPKLLNLVGRIFGVLLFTVFISVVIEWCLMTWYYDSPSHEPAKEMFKAEYSFLSDASLEDSLRSGFAGEAHESVTRAIEVAFFDTGVLEAARQPRPLLSSDNLLIEWIKLAHLWSQEYLMAMLYVLMTFLVRLAILVLSLPVFLVFGFIGLTDGLVRRDLRKFQGVHESAFVYHIAKGAAMPLAITGCMMYLSMPWTIHPNFVITPYAVLFAYAIMLAASKFKKYL